MKRLFGICGGIVAAGMIVFAVYFATRPSAAFNELREAIAMRDRKAMERLVDFPAFRESIKSKLRDELSASAVASKNPFAILGAALADRLIEPIVDIVVSPGGISAMLAGQNVRDIPAKPPVSDGSQTIDTSLAYDGAWEGLSRYVVTVRNQGKQAVMLVMHRQGLFDWRLAELR